MRLKNSTDIPDDLIREIVRLVKPASVTNFKLTITNASYCYRGTAFTAYNEVLVRIGADRHFPHTATARGAYLPMTLETRIAALTMVIAHELRHIWQRNHRTHRVWGARGKYSERDADAYAVRMVRMVRRELPTDVWKRKSPPKPPSKSRRRSG